MRGLLAPAAKLLPTWRLEPATVTVILFIFIMSIYIAIDMPRFGGLIADMAAQPGYRGDAERLTNQFSRIWRAYLRGQVILALVIGTMVGVADTVGVEERNCSGESWQPVYWNSCRLWAR